MNIATYLKLTYSKWLALLVGGLLLSSCSVIYDEQGDCSITYLVKFRYDYNMKFADAFAHEVNTVTLYLIDENGNIVWSGTESGEKLAAEDYAMEVEALPGTYSLMAWAGTDTLNSYTYADTDRAADLTCLLNRKHDETGKAYTDTDIDQLFHGYLADQTFSDFEGVYTYTVPLIKATNNFRVVLQHISGNEIDKDKYKFTITDDNGSLAPNIGGNMAWENSLLPDEEINYRAWHVMAGVAGTTYPNPDKQEAPALRYDDSSDGIQHAFSAAIAELTTLRLVNGKSPRLTVTNSENGEVIFSIPLIDYALLVKGYYNRNMDDQEYLDRQDVYDMVFFLDEGYRWIDTYIYINSWKVVLQDANL